MGNKPILDRARMESATGGTCSCQTFCNIPGKEVVSLAMMFGIYFVVVFSTEQIESGRRFVGATLIAK